MSWNLLTDVIPLPSFCVCSMCEGREIVWTISYVKKATTYAEYLHRYAEILQI